MPRQSAQSILERAASVANLAMLRTCSRPSHIQIETINDLTSLLEYRLASLAPNDTSTRKRILTQLDIHRSLLTPIRRLPVELICHIFYFAAYESPLLTLHVAVTISRVCTVWREIVHGLTELWTKVVVQSVRDFDDYCELFLPLTQGKPPDLRCDDRKILRSLWDRIVLCASRWRTLSLEGQLSMLPDLQVLYMESLERLVVDAYGAPMSADLSALDFVVAPRLRHVALTLDALDSPRQLHVPVARALTSVELDVMIPFPVTHTLPLLRECAETLQFLTLKIRQFSSDFADSYLTSAPETFVMKALTDIRLVAPACALLDHIAAPKVDEVILSHVPRYGSRSLMGFLTRENASQSLHILRVYNPEEREKSVWIPCLQLLDNLTQLHFDELLSDKKFLQQMVLRADGLSLLPSLEGVAIYHIYMNHPELHDAIGDMCDSRQRERVFRGKQAWAFLAWIKD
ncbi:hypothetical protein EV122DRAFT_201202 [Schizophyllum commune]|nr:hypothetical protein K523DRAFT_415281 [Schizophyllum commune Tattone D]